MYNREDLWNGTYDRDDVDGNEYEKRNQAMITNPLWYALYEMHKKSGEIQRDILRLQIKQRTIQEMASRLNEIPILWGDLWDPRMDTPTDIQNIIDEVNTGVLKIRLGSKSNDKLMKMTEGLQCRLFH